MQSPVLYSAHSYSEAVFAPACEKELAEQVAQNAGRQTFWIRGGGTRLQPTQAPDVVLTTRKLDKVVDYEPGALTLIAEAGARVDEVEQLLASEGQSLAFEPMDHRQIMGTTGAPTLGGMVATNASGPRRLLAGACRDHVLGVRFVDGRGRVIKNGGRVMKNVTGMDLGKLLAGSHGTLGVLTQIALKTLPLAEDQRTLAFQNVSVRAAVEIFSKALATPFEVSGAAFYQGTAWLRIEGLERQVAYRSERLLGLFRDREVGSVETDQSRALWSSLRDVRHFAEKPGGLWRLLVKPTDAPAAVQALEQLGGEVSLDWGGGLVWFRGDVDGQTLRSAFSFHASTLVRSSEMASGPVFAPEPIGVANIANALRKTFDPQASFNPGLMGL